MIQLSPTASAPSARRNLRRPGLTKRKNSSGWTRERLATRSITRAVSPKPRRTEAGAMIGFRSSTRLRWRVSWASEKRQMMRTWSPRQRSSLKREMYPYLGLFLAIPRVAYDGHGIWSVTRRLQIPFKPSYRCIAFVSMTWDVDNIIHREISPISHNRFPSIASRDWLLCMPSRYKNQQLPS